MSGKIEVEGTTSTNPNNQPQPLLPASLPSLECHASARSKWTLLLCDRCVDNFFSVLAGLLEFFACISLRYTQPDLPRPFRIPGPRWALVVGLAPAIVLGFAVASATAFQTPLTGGPA